MENQKENLVTEDDLKHELGEWVVSCLYRNKLLKLAAEEMATMRNQHSQELAATKSTLNDEIRELRKVQLERQAASLEADYTIAKLKKLGDKNAALATKLAKAERERTARDEAFTLLETENAVLKTSLAKCKKKPAKRKRDK